MLGVVAVVVASPAVVPDADDDFPLSTYPMFSHDRGRVAAIATAVGLDHEGGVHRLGPRAVGGGDEVMLAVSAARRGAATDPEGYCREVAGRVDDPIVERVEVRTEVRDAVDDVDAAAEPLDVVVHAECPVPAR